MANKENKIENENLNKKNLILEENFSDLKLKVFFYPN